MDNFFRVSTGANVTPLLLAIKMNSDLWDKYQLRTTHPKSPHTQVSDIWVRFNELPEEGNESSLMDEHESIWYPAIHKLPQVRDLIFSLMSFVGGERLGRCLITKLSPGKKIDPHEDGGSHAAYYDRFHIVLQSTPGSLFRCGNESVYMASGDVWWFNNSI